MSLKKVCASLKRNKKFLITTHTNPEGDALGSELAFYRLIKAMGKQAIIVNADPVPAAYYFLPGIDKIKRFKNNLKDTKFDCFVILDCSDLERCAEVAGINKEKKPVVNIDHHISNKKFADINWVEARASSCAEMIYRLYKQMRVPFDKETALLLYVGIMTDTGSFRYTNTTSATHQAAAELLKYRLDIPQIYKNVYENIPFEDSRLLTKILPTLERQEAGRLVWLALKRSLLKQHRNISFDLSEQILSFARAIKDVEVAVLFKENLGKRNEVRVNFRSQGKVDVNKIARFFGGGGHKTASGCTVQGKIEEVRRRVLKKIKASLK